MLLLAARMPSLMVGRGCAGSRAGPHLTSWRSGGLQSLHRPTRSSESDEESDGSRSNSGDGRVNLEQIDADPGASSWSSPSSAQDGQAAAQNQLPEEPDIAITAGTMSDRYDLMFTTAAAEPRASGLESCVPNADKKLVSLVSAHVEGIKKADIDALSQAYGNFDRVVAKGWLFGDLVRGPPLLDRAEAYTVGLKVKYEAGKVAKQEAELKRSYSRVPAADPRRRRLLIRRWRSCCASP